ncbi:MAG: hypothetical protein QGI24_08775, partial [Kiritimatiellia bacterium]|nr:hypothetical protein [Kiritimatiellia bacterium]
EIVFGDITNGAYGDIKHATRLARNMVCNWGMSDELGPQSYGENQELMFLGREVSRSQDYSEDTARRIDTEVSRLLMTAHATAVDILTRERAKLDMIAERLLEHETIDGRDVEEIVEHGRVLSEEEREVIDRKKKEEEESTDTTDEVAGTAGSPGKEPEPHKAPEEPPMSWPGREKEDEEQA